MLWIKANTKKCPSCKAMIEKNGGCNSVRCHNCNVEFCWMCLRLAKDHGGGVHIFNACTNFKLQMKDDEKFAKKFDDANKAKYKLRVYECFYKNYVE